MSGRGGRVKFDITADASGVQRGVTEAEASLNRLNGAGKKAQANFNGLGKGAEAAHGAIGKASSKVNDLTTGLVGLGAKGAIGLVGAGGVVEGLKLVAEKGIEAQAAQAKLEKATSNAGISWQKYGGHIDETLKKQAELSGFTKADLSNAFSNMIRTTGSVSEAFKLNQSAMDIARTKGIGLANAQSLLARVYNGSYTGLKRLGVAVEPVTKAQDALKNSTGKVSDAQKKAAKDADSLATRHEALALIQKKFGGQAEAYGKTTAGSIDRAKVAFNELEESLGQKVLPILTHVTNAVANFVNGINNGTGAGGKFAHAIVTGFNAAKQGVQTAISAINGFIQKNKADIQSLQAAFKNIFTALITFFNTFLLPAAKKVFDGLVTYLKGAFQVIKGIVEVFSGLLTLDFKKMWEGVKNIFGGEIQAIHGMLKAATAPFRQAAALIGQGISGAFNSTLGKLPGVFSDAFNAVLHFFGSLPGKFAHAAMGIPNAIVGVFKNLGKMLVDAVNGAVSEAANALSGLQPHFDVSVNPLHPHFHMSLGGTRLFNRGGAVPGQGSGDKIPALLEPGEFVLNRNAARAVGVPALMALNKKVARFQGGGFVPAGAPVTWERIDQGQDLITTPGGPILASGSGTVIAVPSNPGGFGPAYPVIHYTSGPLAGRSVYYGHTLANVNVGQRVTAGMVISHTGTHGVGNATTPGWAEIGFWPPGSMSAGSAIAPILHSIAHSGPSGVGPSSGSSSGSSGASAPKPPSAMDKLDKRLSHIDLLVSSGTVSQATGTKLKQEAIHNSLPKLHGDNRLQALTDLRQLPKPPAPPKPVKPTVDRTLNNPWLQAYLTHQDDLAAAGVISPDEASANKVHALQNALDAPKGLAGEDRVVAQGMIRSLTPTAPTADEMTQNNLTDEDRVQAHIDAQVRAGDLTPEQGRQAKIAALNDALSNWQLTDDARLELRGELKDLTDAQTDATDAIKAQTEAMLALKDEMKKQNDFATAVTTVSLGAAWKALADTISGQIAGIGYTGRLLSAGSGSVARY